MTIYGVDLSSWKPVRDIGAVVAAGNEFLITKVTGGLTYVNPLYADQIGKARGAGMEVGHFHYLHEATLDPADQAGYRSFARMVAEAEHFLAHLDWRPGEVVALDVEDPDVAGDLSEAVLAWCDYVAARVGVAPLIYTYPFYRDERRLTDPALAEYPLWWAAYDEPERYPTAPWPAWTIRQYTASATVPGIGKDVDRNIFRGDRAAFRALGTPPAATVESPMLRAIRALFAAA